MTLAGEDGAKVTEEAAYYNSLVVCNIPSSEHIPSAHPARPWLSVKASLATSKNAGRQLSRNVLLTDPVQAVSSIDVSGAPNFSIIVDGTLFGPFQRVVISKAMVTETPDAAVPTIPYKLPVSTFFPVDD